MVEAVKEIDGPILPTKRWFRWGSRKGVAHPVRGTNTGTGNPKTSQGGIWRKPWARWLFGAQPAPIDSAANNDPPMEGKQATLLFEPARTKGRAKDTFVVEQAMLRRPSLRSMIFII
jgi:hypothetical protein